MSAFTNLKKERHDREMRSFARSISGNVSYNGIGRDEGNGTTVQRTRQEDSAISTQFDIMNIRDGEKVEVEAGLLTSFAKDSSTFGDQEKQSVAVKSKATETPSMTGAIPSTVHDGAKRTERSEAAAQVDEAAEKRFAAEIKESSIGVCRFPGRGRGLIAKKRLTAGTRILRTQPAVSVLSLPNLTTVCSGCFLNLQEREILLSTKNGSGSGSSSSSHSDAGNVGANGKGKAKGLNRCSGCKALHYCSRGCQVSDWTLHQSECRALQRMRGMYLSTYPDRAKDTADVRWAGQEAVRALARMCWGRKRLGEEWWEKIKAMESHVPSLPENEVMQLAQQVQHLRHYIAAAQSLAPRADPGVLHPANMEDYGFKSTSELLNLCSAFKVNSFTLSSPSLSPIGVSTSPLVALANHACDPNAVVVFPRGGRDMEVIAIRAIEPGEEILTSYIDVSTPYIERQAEITSRYRFTCHCPLCENDSKSSDGKEKVDPRWCVKHQSCLRKGKGKMPSPGIVGMWPTICDACGETFDVDAGTVDALLRKGKQILAQEERGELDPAEARRTLSTLIPSLLTHLPPSSHPLLALLRLHALILSPPHTSSLQELDLAISQLALAYSGAELVYPANHPTLTIILAEWGKLLSLDPEQSFGTSINEKRDFREITVVTATATAKRLELAIVVLRKAVQASQKSFGSVSIVGMEMEGLLRGCEGELGLIRSGVGRVG